MVQEEEKQTDRETGTWLSCQLNVSIRVTTAELFK